MELAHYLECNDPKDMGDRERSLLLASVGTDMDVIRESQVAGRPSKLLAPTMKILRKAPQELHSVQFHPDGETVMGGGSDGILEMYSIYGHCSPIQSMRTSKTCIRSSGYLKGGGQVYAADDSGTLSFWDIANNSIVRRYGSNMGEGRYHTHPIMDAKGSKDGNLFVTGDSKGTMMIWDVRTHSSVQKMCLSRHSQVTSILCCAWGRGDKMVYMGTDRGSLVMVDLRRGTKSGPVDEFGRPEEIDQAFNSEVAGPLGLELKRKVDSDGKVRLSQSLKRRGAQAASFPQAHVVGRARIHDCVRVPNNHKITGLAVSPDGGYVSTFSSDSVVRVYNADYITDKKRLICELPPGPVHNFEQINMNMAWHPDGKHLAVGSANRKVYVYKNMDRLYTEGNISNTLGLDANTSDLIEKSGVPSIQQTLEGHISTVTDVAWHPKEAILGSVGTDGQIILGELNL
eukprot:GHVH01004586.1.p1 GENE.GHVH01004586.1~~GHVH01004586.1.p1  ORF type:complete len:457 (+),score=46.29 GHVH01004586.1:21-1391(+)